MRRVLIISHSTPFFPGPGAETRMYCLTRELAHKFEITFLLPALGDSSRIKLDALKEFGSVNTFPAEIRWRPLEWRLRHTLERFGPLRQYMPFLKQPQMVREIGPVDRALRTSLKAFDWAKYDLIHVVHPHLALIIGQVENNLPRTLDWIDERAIALKRNLEFHNPYRWKLAGSLEIARVERFQARVAPLFDASFVSSEIDADRLLSCTGRRPIVVPNGVDLGYFNNSVRGRPTGNKLIFTGHMSYEPNVDAVLFFCRQVLPTIRAMVPNTELLVVGMQPHPSVVTLENDYPGVVTVTGAVADVRPYLVGSAVCVAPLRSGGGTRLKILEAMSMERPVVSTRVGCEGLAAENGYHLSIQDDPASIAQEIIKLLSDDVEWNRLARGGRELVEQRYGWNMPAATMAKTWDTLTDT